MVTWTIEPIPLYRFRVPGPEVLFQRGFGETIDMMIYAFLLRGGGHTVLVDTGLHADHEELNRAIRARKGDDAGFVACGDGLAEELTRRSAVPELVVVTSFGPYAVGGLDRLPTSPVVASARGLRDMARLEEPALLHPVPPVAAARLREARGIDGEADLLDGLTFIETGVHHPASAAVLVRTAAGMVAIVDPVFVARNLIDGLALGAAEFAGGWHRLVRMLGASADAILPIHDPEPIPVPRERWHATLRAA
jgi:glyoxylase-like metal-dependent hydrolase (beta-lactamase superfamily II)